MPSRTWISRVRLRRFVSSPMPMTRKTCIFLLAVVLFAAVPPSSASQGLKLQGGPVIIELDPVAAPVGEDQSSRLRWNRVGSPSKIMVGSSAMNQRFDLFVDAVGVRRGVGVGEVRLVDGSPAKDFVVGITGPAAGRCTLNYRAEARAEHGYGRETHTVTYTITGQ